MKLSHFALITMGNISNNFLKEIGISKKFTKEKSEKIVKIEKWFHKHHLSIFSASLVMNQKNIFAAFLCSPFSWDVFVLRLDYYSPFGLLQNILVFSIEAGSKWEGTEEWHSKSRIMSLRWSGNESLEKNRWEKEGMIPRPKYYHREEKGG